MATLTGHPLFAVKVNRRELGRPIADPILSCWTPEQDRLLGTMPDDEVARRLWRSKMAVQKRRLGLELRAIALSSRYERRRNPRCLEPCPTRSWPRASNVQLAA